MKILVIGSGGREHVLAWKLARSPRVEQVYVAPGNGGTTWEASPGVAPSQNVDLDAMDLDGLLAFAAQTGIDLTVVGPEAPLVAGIVDAFLARGQRVFGPTQAAAQLEGSKVYAKRFMLEHEIPTGRAAWFTDYPAALDHLRQAGAPVVVKADGLAAGKGVTVCATLAEAEAALHAAMVERVFGDAGDAVLIEECLSGQEASLLAFCDGRSVVPMVVAQDHKAAYDGDRGPNTGGMGCYAPAPLMPPALVERVTREVLQPAVAGMAARGTPYVGVLYAGLMLDAPEDGDAPDLERAFKVLEFNCRFGDPEAQVILPLLETDLVEVLEACVEGRLGGGYGNPPYKAGSSVGRVSIPAERDSVGRVSIPATVRWKEASATCVVMASGGYPGAYERGKPIAGLDAANALPGVTVYHAGTRCAAGRGAVLTDGGRVLGVTAVAPALAASIERAYAGVARIDFEGAIYRTDIGAKGLARA